jgi:riboflavin-specific deaminase-like protein
MGANAEPDPRITDPGPVMLKRLLPPAEPATVEEIIDGLNLSDLLPAGRRRPQVIMNMASTVDGRASIGGRSGPIGDRADHELLQGLRTVVDAVMAGAGTVRRERYGKIVPDARRRRLRLERGLDEEPLACIVSASLSLPADLPLLNLPGARVVIVTSSRASLPECPAEVEYVRAGDGLVDLPGALAELRERFGVRTLLCEGGPHLHWHMLAAALVDELFFTLAPKLAGEDRKNPHLGILAGPPLAAPIELKLTAVLEGDSQLLLRYGVCASAPARVSPETMLRSSLAS